MHNNTQFVVIQKCLRLSILNINQSINLCAQIQFEF